MGKNDPTCRGWHSHRYRSAPRAKYRVWHRDDKAKDLPPRLLCGTHARSYRDSAARWGTGSVWIVEEIER